MRVVSHEDISKLSASAAVSEFCEWVQVGIDVHIPHHRGTTSNSSPWFSSVHAAAIVHRNPFFHLYQQNESSESKVKFTQTSDCCKRVLEPTKLAYANKTKRVHHFPRNLALKTFDKLLIVFSIKVNLLYLLSSDKAKSYSRNFFKNSNLDDSCISLPIFDFNAGQT